MKRAESAADIVGTVGDVAQSADSLAEATIGGTVESISDALGLADGEWIAHMDWTSTFE